MFRVVIITLLTGAVLLSVSPVQASTQGELSAAALDAKAVFLVVTQAGAAGTDRALEIARQAQAMAPQTSAVVLMDRGAAENQKLVERYRLLGAPVPLILVIAPNGVVAGGALLKDLTAEMLVKTIPTPKKTEMLMGLHQKMAVLVVFSKKTMVEARSAVYEACSEATRRLDRKVTTVVVDMDDKAEKRWREELNVGLREPLPVTVVFNAKGQKTQVFRAVMSADDLVKAITKKVECCPGGSC